ncbi:Flagellar hook-associated protein 2 [Xylophilus ampelinus]|nr:flagellar filament capping protein FliD [Variovorax sp.]VTY20931.1 Flagellar hook-associated protein 2 [Xylophilus ampelinus]
MAASVSSAGIGSGLDVESIVTKLMNVEKVPLTKLQSTASAIDSKISAYGTLQSQFASLQDVANKLATASAWNSKTATSSDATVVKAAITDGARASATSFSVQVSQLAKAQSAASAAVASGSAVGTGTLKLQLGNWSSGSFVAKDGSSEVDIDITAADATVSGVAAKINAANAGVTATVVTDSTGERLLLRSSTTGESSGFRLQAVDGDGSNADDAGLSRLAFDPAAGAFGMAGAAQASALQMGQNARATLNGIDIDSETNTLSDTVPGLSMTLTKETTSAVEVSVAVDNTAITKLANDFVTAYNATNSMLNQATKYDASTKTAALLQGDSTTVSMQNALRRLLSTTTSGNIPMLSNLGIGVSKAGDGSIALDSAKFGAALAKSPADVQTFFTNATGNEATQGFGLKLKGLMDTILGTGGAIASKTASLDKQKKANSSDQDAMNNRLAATEARIRAQYTALDTKVASLNVLSTYITNQIAQWNKSTN